MENSKKNQPSKILLVVFAIIALVVIFYLSMTVFFPELFQEMSTGEAVPVSN